MSKPVVLVTTYYLRPGDAVDRYLQSQGVEVRHVPTPASRTDEEFIETLRGVDGVIAGSDRYTARVLAAVDRLKVIARTGVGYDTIDLEAATARGIVVCNTAGANRHAVAEWAIMLMLLCAKKAAANLGEVARGGWERTIGIDLAGKTLGIVGLGTIGKEVAQRMRGFEMRLLAYDVRQDQQFAEAHGVSYVPLEQLLRESDLVTIHCNLGPTSRHLINAERLSLMKPTAYLVNAARGAIVDTVALGKALKEGRIAGAALDVFEQEPLPLDSPLRGLDNLYVSPHAAGSTADAHVVSERMAADNVLRVLRGERPVSVVNPAVLGG